MRRTALLLKAVMWRASETLMQAHRRAHAPRKEGASQETKEAAGKGGGVGVVAKYWEVTPINLGGGI